MDAEENQSRSMASLGRLPPELKAQIVRDLYFILAEEADQPDPWLEHLNDKYGEEVALTATVQASAGSEEQLVRSYEIMNGTQQADELPLVDDIPKGGEDDEDAWEDEGDDEKPAGGVSGQPTLEELMKTRRVLNEISQHEFASLHNLSLVNREFAELSFPWIWHEIDLEDTNISHLWTLVTEVLPRHAQHVRSLAFGQSDGTILPFMTSASDRYRAERDLIETAERLSKIRDPKVLEYSVRRRRTKSLMIAELIKMCPNIERIDCEAFQKHPIPEEAYEDDPTIIREAEVYHTDHALEAIRSHLGPKLTDLTLLINDDDISSELDVAKLLEGCPKLLRVDLAVYCGRENARDRTRLHEALLKLEKLETLDIGAGQFINDEFAQLVLERMKSREEEEAVSRSQGGESTSNPFPNLQCLALVECPDLSFESFFNLIHCFSSTLRILDIDSTPHANHPEVTKKYLGRPFNLPQLRTLVLSTPHEAKFLDSFVDCKLVEFCLGFCPSFSYKDIEDFITLHQTTLKKIEVADDAALSEAQFESLEVFCHAKGISVELLEPDSDEEDEEDEIDPSDLDEDDEGGWYDEQTDDDEPEEIYDSDDSQLGFL
ncbi:uncharacterized protein JCM6883_003641 [Sporobolomyces salmoneus]|uniref:uncharacterized protein n=1 Tax=Sporobolomyces salmoneus TaxID=183962 RepID=UPI0031775DB9